MRHAITPVSNGLPFGGSARSFTLASPGVGRALFVAALAGLLPAAVTWADIDEDEVMLLYNSLDSESSQIADWYDDLHPGVVHCDIAVQYDPTVQPDGYWATKKYISPLKFKQVFIDSTGPFAQCLAANPQLLCIVTTRGVPGAISDTVTPLAGPNGGIYASLEATLCRYRLGDLFQEPPTWNPVEALAPVVNPYYVSGSPYELQPFEDFLEDACNDLPNPVCLGHMFLVSRLDSATPGYDYDGNGVVNNLDGVRRQLLGYASLQLNQYATTALSDTSPLFCCDLQGLSYPTNNYYSSQIIGSSILMWDAEYCAFSEETAEFIHGSEGDPFFDPQVEGPILHWPLISLVTLGRHHESNEQDGEVILNNYASYYDAHPLGVFCSIESWNAWQVHGGDGTYGHDPAAGLGQMMEWIAAGGGFAIGYIQEPGDVAIEPRTLLESFFVQNLTWAEAAVGSMARLGAFAVAIGDPLVVVKPVNPDVNGDRIVNSADYQIVLLAIGTSNPQADINGDGIVNQADINLVREAYGRNCAEPPTEPFPGIGCGDLGSDNPPFFDVDWIVDSIDLGIFYQAWTDAGGDPGSASCPLLDCWAQCPCQGDFNGDAIIDQQDEQIILGNLGVWLLDPSGDGCVDEADLAIVLALLTTPPICVGNPLYDPLADVNCDQCVTQSDETAIRDAWEQGDCD